MSKVVFIFGAGASYHAGAPLMWDFLDRAENLYGVGKCGGKEESFKLVFKALQELQIIHHKAQIDLRNLESVLAAFEMVELLGNLGSLSSKIIRNLTHAMKDVILETLLRSVKFIPGEENIMGEFVPRARTGDNYSCIGPTEAYYHFCQLIQQRIYDKVDFSIITFNYDLCLDYALPFCGIPINYRLEERTSNAVRVQS